MGNHGGAEGTSEGGHRDTHLWETSRQDRRVHEVYDRLTRIAKEANTGRGVAECVSVPEERNEGNPHVRFCEGGSRSYGLYPSTRPALQKCETYRNPKGWDGNRFSRPAIACRYFRSMRAWMFNG